MERETVKRDNGNQKAAQVCLPLAEQKKTKLSQCSVSRSPVQVYYSRACLHTTYSLTTYTRWYRCIESGEIKQIATV